MSCHEGVSCDNCLKSNFIGKRFKCLICYDYDLCESCHSLSVATSRHLASHPMQCILTRNEFEKYYAGESISPDTPPSFVCPFCAKLGFSETLLREHVIKEHEDAHKEVICPVCAAMPSGDPNLVTEDLAHHLSMEHRGSRDADESSANRHIRRMFYPGRGIRTRNHRSMHFSGGPIGTSMTSSSSLLSNNNASSSIRDSMDPIAELLSQLSGVRRSAQQLQHNVTTASQLQELQAQLQHERQRAAEIRQQLERFPNKLSAGGSSAQKSTTLSYAEAAASVPKAPVSTKTEKDADDDKFLLSNFDNLNLSEAELEKQARDDVDRSHFVQELLLSMLSDAPDLKPTIVTPPNLDRAIPVECPLFSASSTNRNEQISNDALSSLPNIGDENTSGFPDLAAEKEKSTGSGETAPQKPEFQQVEPQPPLFQHASVQINRESDEDRPPSPTPIQGHERLIQARVYTPGQVSVGVFPEAGAQIGNYGREDTGSGNITKHVR